MAPMDTASTGSSRRSATGVVEGEEPPARAPDPEVFTRRMDAYGVDMVGPPPAL